MKTYENLGGVVPALITPLSADGKVDEAGLRRVVRRVIHGGATGILACGTAGEGPLFREDDRQRIVETIKDESGGRVPIIVGVDALSTGQAVDAVSRVAEYGGDYALVLPPFYVPIPEGEVYEFYREVSENSPVPVLMYNIPQLTKVNVGPGTMQRIASLENIAGVKDSGGDLTWFQNVQNSCQSPSFKMFQGRTTLWFVSAVLGADGVIDPAINIVPEWDVEVLTAVREGDLARAKEIQGKLLKLARAYSAPGYSVYLGVKAALAQLGVIEKHVLKPFSGLSEQFESNLKRSLDELGIQ